MKLFILSFLSILVFIGVPVSLVLAKSEKQKKAVKLTARIVAAIGITVFAVMVIGFISAFIRLNF